MCGKEGRAVKKGGGTFRLLDEGHKRYSPRKNKN